MCQSCSNMVDLVWNFISVNRTYRTPDYVKGVLFEIEERNSYFIVISPQNIKISKKAFIATIHYLKSNQHSMSSPCKIKSSNAKATAGPLCAAAREENKNVRCINYILPILQEYLVVGINHAQPNTTWLVA